AKRLGPPSPVQNKRLERTRHQHPSLLSCVGEPLKRIYKASQEKKRIVLPGVPKWFLFSTYQHPVVCFRNELACVIASCKTAFVFVLLCFSCACVYFMVVINLQ